MKKLLAITISAILLTTSPSWATEHESELPPPIQTNQILKSEQQGMEAMRDIQYARVTLFRGNPEEAKKLIANAKTLLSDESIFMKSMSHSGKKAPQEGDYYSIINTQLILAEDFKASPEKQKVINTANKKLSLGDKKGAIDDLKLAGIDISEVQWLMPVKQTLNKIESAQELMNNGKYYEANLALKGAEEGIITDTVSIESGN